MKSARRRTKLLYDSPAPAAARQPEGTRSQIVAYYDEEGNRLAIVHCYLRPDGTLGGSGRPDPKWLLHKGKIYKAARVAEPTADDEDGENAV